MISRFILRLIFELLNFSHLLFFHLFVTSTGTTIWAIHPLPISSFSYRRPLIMIRLNSSISDSEASKILLLGHFWLPFSLRCSAGSSFELDRRQSTFFKIYCPLQAAPISRAFRYSFHERFCLMGSWYFHPWQTLTLRTRPVHAPGNSRNHWQNGGSEVFFGSRKSMRHGLLLSHTTSRFH